VKAIAKRLCRLEDRFEAADGKPRQYQRMVVIRLDRMPGLEALHAFGLSCRTAPCPRAWCWAGAVRAAR